MDNYDANVQIYDTAKYLEIYCFCSQGKNEKTTCRGALLVSWKKQEQTPLRIRVFATFLPTFEVQ